MRRTQVRLCMALLVLALALGMTGVADRSAEADYCQFYSNCETCMSIEQACLDGDLYQQCGGDFDCCRATLMYCWNCCSWY